MAHEKTPRPAPAATEREGYDRHEVNARLVGGVVLGSVLFIVASIFAVQLYFDRNFEQQVYVKVLSPVADDLQNLRAREDQELHSYQVINREQGLVRLPIGRAMELLAAEAAAGSLKYPTTPYRVKTAEEQAAATAPQGGRN